MQNEESVAAMVTAYDEHSMGGKTSANGLALIAAILIESEDTLGVLESFEKVIKEREIA